MEKILGTKNINGINYTLSLVYPNNNGFNIPYLIVIPDIVTENTTIALESNNLESTDFNSLVDNGIHTCEHLITIFTNSSINGVPIVLPIIPSNNPSPYYQQLSSECFDDLAVDDKCRRIDLQVINIIQDAKHIIEDKTKIKVKDKIFLNGYSSSGVFAQRFALLHPNIIDTVCIGGASASIPMPEIMDLDYPLGVRNLKQLISSSFDKDSYKQIHFRYYVGEYEDVPKSETRFDEDMQNAPMHDMTYMDRSVDSNIGKQYRIMFGRSIINRASICSQLLQLGGIDIEHCVIPGRGHNDSKKLNIIGVNEKMDEYICKVYQEMQNLQLNKTVL